MTRPIRYRIWNVGLVERTACTLHFTTTPTTPDVMRVRYELLWRLSKEAGKNTGRHSVDVTSPEHYIWVLWWFADNNNAR